MTDIAADPFGERRGTGRRVRLTVLGAPVEFASDSAALLALARAAFAGLPRAAPRPGRLEISLRLDPRPAAKTGKRPPRMRLDSGAGLLHGTMGALASVVIAPAQRSALVVVNRALLGFPYHLRYEVIEFVTLSLVARVHGLVPLHAACVAHGARAALVLGDSGSGKSTFALLAALDGLGLVAEDSAFVAARGLDVAGAPGFLHVRADSLRHLAGARRRSAIRRAPVIERRSGVRKHAYDLRGSGALARGPVRLAAVIVLGGARRGRLLRPLSRAQARAALRRTQPYGRAQAGWRAFERAVARVPAWSLARAARAADRVGAVRALLAGETH